MNSYEIKVEDCVVKKSTASETIDGVKVTVVMYKFDNGVYFVAEHKVEYV